MIIKRKLYTDRHYYLDQREFGLISNLWKKGKKKIVNKLDENIKDYDKLAKELDIKARIEEAKELGKGNKELIDKLKEEAKRRNISVLEGGDFKTGFKDIEKLKLEIEKSKASKKLNSKRVAELNKEINKLKNTPPGKDETGINFIDKNNLNIDEIKARKEYKTDRRLKNIIDAMESNDAILGFRGSAGPPSTFAHELGHYDNRKGLITKQISKRAEKARESEGTEKDSIVNAVKRRIFQPIEENNAWKTEEKF